MCLRELKRPEKDPPRRKWAWKVVTKERRPQHRNSSRRIYKKGSTHKVPRAEIMAQNYNGRYHNGLHVYVSVIRAKELLAYTSGCHIIKVAVDPKHWVADGVRGDAVYTQIKVLT